ncbi:chlamydia major outer membrane family protein, partial [Chlamydia psittaci 84-8471/1]
RRLKTILPSSP